MHLLLSFRSPNTLKIPPLLSSLYSSQPYDNKYHDIIGSPSRVQKLIASQSDPLLAKEIFDLAAAQPHFRHSYSSFFTLILKLGRSRHLSLVDDLLRRLKSQTHHYSPSPSLFTHLIKIYGDAHLPHKALTTFYSMFQFNTNPSSKHLNLLLRTLLAHRNFLRPAFDVFKDAHRRGVVPDTQSYNILMRAFCLNDDLSVAYHLFNKMFERDILPDVESYRILMQGLCRKGQVNTAVDFLEDMINKGYVPDSLSYTSLLNSLCRKKQLREAYKLLCRMKVKGCNPDVVHYNTVILGFCREGRSADACKVLEDMAFNGCLPNLVSYRTLVIGLCQQGMLDEATSYLETMVSKGFSPHFSVVHGLVKGLCNVGRVEEACGVLEEVLRHGEVPHTETWLTIVPGVCEEMEIVKMEEMVKEVMRIEIKPNTRIVDAAAGLENYLINKIRTSGLCHLAQAVKGDVAELLKGVGDKTVIEELKRILEMARRASTRREVLHSNFLTPPVMKESMQALAKLADLKAVSQGGYPQAERCRISVGHPEVLTSDPDIIAAVSITGNFGFQPCSHGDFLGAILGTGIAREKVGDVILQGEKGAQVIIVPELIDFLMTSLNKVGNVPVSLTKIPLISIDYEPPSTKSFKTIEASARIDAIASAGFKISRSKLVDLIRNGDVRLNWTPVTKNGATLKPGDVVSVRGMGRLKIGEINTTRKGKFAVELIRYL